MARAPKHSGPLEPGHLHGRLHDRYGELHWWPADSPFEIMVGAVLTQRTSWSNVERAITNLRKARIDSPRSLLALSMTELEGLVRPSGTYRQKASRLRALFSLVEERAGGDLKAFLDIPQSQLRVELLCVKGIGPETADSILLYAAGRPVFVVDAYTRRILQRLGVDAGRSYDDMASWFMEGLPDDVAIYNNLHAMLVVLAKEHCRTRPRCPGCPLEDICRQAQASQ